MGGTWESSFNIQKISQVHFLIFNVLDRNHSTKNAVLRLFIAIVIIWLNNMKHLSEVQKFLPYTTSYPIINIVKNLSGSCSSSFGIFCTFRDSRRPSSSISYLRYIFTWTVMHENGSKMKEKGPEFCNNSELTAPSCINIIISYCC